MGSWETCKNILCIRADNMGDVIMSGPALRALKSSFSCRIGLLTSSVGSGIAGCMPEIDQLIVSDLPWIKSKTAFAPEDGMHLIELLKSHRFDGAVIFTVYSQNPLPAAMLAFLAGIPRRLAYCRENPYELLTDWFPDKEPYEFILHQVERDLKLVQSIGADISHDHLQLSFSNAARTAVKEKLNAAGMDNSKPYIILHPGVSEKKRRYPLEQWIETAERLGRHDDFQIGITGSVPEKQLADTIAERAACPGIFSLAGTFSVEELVALVYDASLVISVNTSTIHIAAATHTPTLVLYALTNPQHTPWKTPSVVLPFSVDEMLASRNEVIRYVNDHYFREFIAPPKPEEIYRAAMQLMKSEVGSLR